MTCIKEKIIERHYNDKDQLDIVFSDNKRIIVEAPAGCGKTRTLVSKVVYLLSTKALPQNKKILVLTFGVNAAYKIKKEVMNTVPKLIDNISTKDIEKKIFITNFHGLARRILRNYGYLLHDELLNLNEFNVVDDSNMQSLTNLEIGVLQEEAYFLSDYSDNIKKNEIHYINKNFDKYISLILKKFVPNKYITYNAILMLVVKILMDYNQILNFYQQYFPYIIVDEFQDTGILSWGILKKLFGEDTFLLFMGATI